MRAQDRRDRAGAGAQVDRHAALGRQQDDRSERERLGLRPRHVDTGVHEEVDPTEPRPADDPRERLARDATPDELVEVAPVSLRGRDQGCGLDLRRDDPRGRQRAGGRVVHHPHRLTPSRPRGRPIGATAKVVSSGPAERRDPPHRRRIWMRRTARLFPVVLTLVTLVAWLAEPAIAAAGKRPPVIVAAGDISPEGDGYDDETAAVIDDIAPDAVLTLGDNQYPDGELTDFRRYYDENWGRFLDMTYPAPGNHDCHVPRCAGYFDYFGDRAGDGTYAYRIGRWLLVSLNSEGDIDAQDAFLRARLAASDARCELVYYHHPRFSSGPMAARAAPRRGGRPRTPRAWT